MDYILLNRPIFFLLYDREKYETKDRELHSFFNDFLVGSISTNQDKLEEDLLYSFTQKDDFKEERSKVIEKSYQNTDDNSSERIFRYIQEYYLRNN